MARPTVQGYFEVLTDTLLGAWLPAWRPRVKVKEVQHPKFYLFDCGVLRALSRRLREPLDSAERGHLLETLVFNELRAHLAYSNCGGTLAYYRVQSGAEVDFIWSRGKHSIGIEVKAGRQWKPGHGQALRELSEKKMLTQCHAVYLGDTAQQDGPVSVRPLHAFLEELSAGRIIPSSRRRR